MTDGPVGGMVAVDGMQGRCVGLRVTSGGHGGGSFLDEVSGVGSEGETAGLVFGSTRIALPGFGTLMTCIN